MFYAYFIDFNIQHSTNYEKRLYKNTILSYNLNRTIQKGTTYENE